MRNSERRWDERNCTAVYACACDNEGAAGGGRQADRRSSANATATPCGRYSQVCGWGTYEGCLDHALDGHGLQFTLVVRVFSRHPRNTLSGRVRAVSAHASRQSAVFKDCTCARYCQWQWRYSNAAQPVTIHRRCTSHCNCSTGAGR